MINQQCNQRLSKKSHRRWARKRRHLTITWKKLIQHLLKADQNLQCSLNLIRNHQRQDLHLLKLKISLITLHQWDKKQLLNQLPQETQICQIFWQMNSRKCQSITTWLTLFRTQTIFLWISRNGKNWEFCSLMISLGIRPLLLTIIWESVKMTYNVPLGKSIRMANYRGLVERFMTIFMKASSKRIFITDGEDSSTI